MKLYLNILTKLMFIISILITDSCTNKNSETTLYIKKFELKHIKKNIEFETSLNFDSIYHPSQYLEDALVLFDNKDSVKIYISIDRKQLVDIKIENSLFQTVNDIYENKDSMFYSCNIDSIKAQNRVIKFAHCLIRNEISETYIMRYKLKAKESMYYIKFYLGVYHVDLDIEFRKKNLNENMLIQQILEHISLK